jgi:hypothetical protein
MGALAFPWIELSDQDRGRSQGNAPGNGKVIISRADKHSNVVLVLCEIHVLEQHLHSFAATLYECLKPAEVVVFDGIHWTSIQSPVQPPSTCRVIGAAASNMAAPLEPLTTVTGMPAALVTYGQVRGIPCRLCLAPMETGMSVGTDDATLFANLDTELLQISSFSQPEEQLQLKTQKLALSPSHYAQATAHLGVGGQSSRPPHLYL